MPILVVVEEINKDEHLHLRGDWTLSGGNKGVILGVAFPKLGPRWAAPSKKYIPIPLEVVNIFLDFGLSHWFHLLLIWIRRA
jgi:hypothetical protein